MSFENYTEGNEKSRVAKKAVKNSMEVLPGKVFQMDSRAATVPVAACWRDMAAVSDPPKKGIGKNETNSQIANGFDLSPTP